MYLGMKLCFVVNANVTFKEIKIYDINHINDIFIRNYFSLLKLR